VQALKGLIGEDAIDIPWRLENAARGVQPVVQADEALGFPPFKPFALALPHSPFRRFLDVV